MKQLPKLLLAFILIFSGTAAMCQDIPVTTMKQTWGETVATGSVLDSVKTTAAHYFYTNAVNGEKAEVIIVVTATEQSGTTAGTITLEVSADGTDWCSYYTSMDSTYSFSLSDVTGAQVYRWKILNAADKYYRIKAVGISTPNFLVKSKYYGYAAKR